MDILDIVKSYYSNYTSTQKKIADYLINNPTSICYITLAQLSKNIGCSEITILNFCKKIGYESFLKLKEAFRDYNYDKVDTFSKSTVNIEKIMESADNSNELIHNIVSMEKNQLDRFYNEVNFEQIENISNKMLNSKYIYIFAHDASKTLGDLLFTRLQILNLSPVMVDMSDMYKTEFILKQITNDDIAFFISFPNYYYAVEGIAKIVSEITSNIILITDSLNCPVSSFTKDILFCQSSTEIFNNSWLAPLACLNLISNTLAIKTNFRT